MSEYLVYCIQSVEQPSRTYIGCTNNFKRRLRQHCGYIKGGARYTHGQTWRPVFHVGPMTRRDALSFEWHVKHRRVKHRRGIAGRIQSLERLLLTTASPGWRVKSALSAEAWHTWLGVNDQNSSIDREFLSRLE